MVFFHICRTAAAKKRNRVLVLDTLLRFGGPVLYYMITLEIAIFVVWWINLCYQLESRREDRYRRPNRGRSYAEDA